MKFYIRPLSEPSIKAWGLRIALGPAMILDGLIHLCTLTMVATMLELQCAKRLARARLETMKG